jgi:hypothetical protein
MSVVEQVFGARVITFSTFMVFLQGVLPGAGDRFLAEHGDGGAVAGRAV